MNNEKVSLTALMTGLNALNNAVEQDPNNALESARKLSEDANLPHGWIARVELGFEVMGRDGEITPEEAMAVIDTASKLAFITPDSLDPFFMDNTPFLELMEMDAALIANEAILAENERILDANERKLDEYEAKLKDGLDPDTPIGELKELHSLKPIPHI